MYAGGRQPTVRGSLFNPITLDEDGVEKISSADTVQKAGYDYGVNKGMKLLLNMGYKPGTGLGKRNDGIAVPVPVIPSKRKLVHDQSGIGCHSDKKSFKFRNGIGNTTSASVRNDGGNSIDVSKVGNKRSRFGEKPQQFLERKDTFGKSRAEQITPKRPGDQVSNYGSSKRSKIGDNSHLSTMDRMDGLKRSTLIKNSTTKQSGSQVAHSTPNGDAPRIVGSSSINTYQGKRTVKTPPKPTDRIFNPTSPDPVNTSVAFNPRQFPSAINPIVKQPWAFLPCGPIHLTPMDDYGQLFYQQSFNGNGLATPPCFDMHFQHISSMMPLPPPSVLLDMPPLNTPGSSTHTGIMSQSAQDATSDKKSAAMSSSSSTEEASAHSLPTERKKMGIVVSPSYVHPCGKFPAMALGRYRPDLSRTLTLNVPPKKYRNIEFIQDWASRFSRDMKRTRVFFHDMKGLIEFPTIEDAENAFNSPIIQNIHLTSVRAYWYNGKNNWTCPNSKKDDEKTVSKDLRKNDNSRKQPYVPTILKHPPQLLPSPKAVTIIPGQAIRAVKERKTQEQNVEVQNTPSETASSAVADTEVSREPPSTNLEALRSMPLSRSTDVKTSTKFSADERSGTSEANHPISEEIVPISGVLLKTHSSPSSSSGFRSGSLILNASTQVFETPNLSTVIPSERPHKEFMNSAVLRSEMLVVADEPEVVYSAKQPSVAEAVTKASPSCVTTNIPSINNCEKVTKKSKPEFLQDSEQVGTETDSLQDIPSVRSTQPLKVNVCLMSQTSLAKISGRVELRSSGRSADAVLVPNKKPKASLLRKAQSANIGKTRYDAVLETPVVVSSLLSAKQDECTGSDTQVSTYVSSVKVVSEEVKLPQNPIPPSSGLKDTMVQRVTDDAASAFITEAVRSASPKPAAPASSFVNLQPRGSLQSRQSRLEQMISQSRNLMHQLDEAEGREERDDILRKIREINRIMDLAMKEPLALTQRPRLNEVETRSVNSHDSHWPFTTESSMILDISDDEDFVPVD